MNRREFNKFYKDYVYNVDIDNIEYRCFTYNELLEFLKSNYYDDELNKYVCWQPDGFNAPFGMYFLDFMPYSEDLSYLLGFSKNSKGTNTIVFCMIYDRNYASVNDDNKKISYIDKVETNYFFRNRGIFTKSLNYIREVLKDNNIVVISPESVMGSKISLFKKISSLFDGEPKVMDEDEYIDSLSKRQRW